jgi:hypothetical protein
MSAKKMVDPLSHTGVDFIGFPYRHVSGISPISPVPATSPAGMSLSRSP